MGDRNERFRSKLLHQDRQGQDQADEGEDNFEVGRVTLSGDFLETHPARPTFLMPHHHRQRADKND